MSVKSEAAKEVWRSYTEAERAARVAKVTIALQKYTEANYDLMVLRNQKKSRRRKISKSLKKQWRSGIRKPRVQSLAERKKKSRTLKRKYRKGIIKPAKWTYARNYVSGWFVSKKCGRKFFYRSSWERLVMEWLEKDKRVLNWRTDHVRIPYQYKGNAHTFFVDFLVKLKSGKKIAIEVKPDTVCEFKRNKCKLKAAKKYCENLGISFLIIDSLAKIGRLK